MLKKSLVLMALVAATACASAANSGTGTYRDPIIITEQEIDASMESNGFDVVQKLRPMFLKTRGRSTINAGGSEYASVFVDGVYYGELNSLRNLVSNQIHEIRYLNGPESAGKYGIRYGQGAIDVKMK
jgi:hypothetical protein